MNKKTVVVGLSGGVDSSLTAYLLKKQGYEVIGLFMKNWEEDSDECPDVEDFNDVVRVCEQIDIPFYTVNFAKQYWDEVFEEFLEKSRRGLTPNPDILCNKEIKFKHFYRKALELGADYLATGHYCQNKIINGTHTLAKGVDPGKDQSYFLYAISGEVLPKVLFPLGGMEKREVRERAQAAGLATSAKKDSTGICFIGKRNFKSFLNQYIASTPGPIVNVDGGAVGEHDGLAFYTIGQRKGMGVGGAGEAWFVVGKEVESNTLFVAQGGEHRSLFSSSLIARELTWINEAPSGFPFRCRAKVRYRQTDQQCTVTSIEGDMMEVLFDVPQRAVTPGQSIVLYDGETCLGGGVISKTAQQV